MHPRKIRVYALEKYHINNHPMADGTKIALQTVHLRTLNNHIETLTILEHFEKVKIVFFTKNILFYIFFKAVVEFVKLKNAPIGFFE
jgi:tryptophan synthase alpha subunit